VNWGLPASNSLIRDGKCPGRKDGALLDLAESEARLVVTLDKDFWQIAIQRRIPLEQSGVVLFRVHPATPENLKPHSRVVCSGADSFFEFRRKSEEVETSLDPAG
jgi:predicted nuclease of predicted toxin-antitoxin system